MRAYQVTNQGEIDRLESCLDRQGGGAQAMTYDLRLGLHGNGKLELSDRLFGQLKGLYRSSPTGGYQGKVPRALRIDILLELSGEELDPVKKLEFAKRAGDLVDERRQESLLD